MEFVLLVGESDFEMISHLRALYYPKDHIKIGRSHLLRVSLSFSGLGLENERNSLFLKMLFVEGTKLIEGGEYFAVFIIETDFFIHGAVMGDLGSSTEDAEIGVFVFVGLLGLELLVKDFDFEIVNE